MLQKDIDELREKLELRKKGLTHIEEMLDMHELLDGQPARAFKNCSLSIDLRFNGPAGDIEAVLTGYGDSRSGRVRMRPKDARMLIRCMQRITLENINEKVGGLSL